jgi:hypothetical protein
MSFFQCFYLFEEVFHFPGSWFVIEVLIVLFFLGFGVRTVIFIGITLNLWEVLAIDLSFPSFQLKHVLLHNLLLLKPSPDPLHLLL